ncbi:MAG: hypothetical protein JST92_25020, partial [Deltaproteobacteria bacterium]|nr:hypothetical protein [Deltaproteobacteria bacterium]
MRLHVAALLFTLGLALSAQAAGLDKISRAERTFIEQQEPARVREALDRLQVEKFQLGLDRDTDFTVRTSFTDAFGQTHVRVKQVWRGVPVWGSEGVLHVDRDGGALETTEDFSRGIHVDLEARTTREQALQIAEGHFQLKGALRGAPQPQLVIVPITKMIPLVHRRALNAVEQYKQTLGHALAWHVHLATENRLDGTRRRDYLIDAKSGKILRSWSSLETGAATGTGHSQWTGTVNLDTSTATGGYELRDQTRGNGTGNETRDMANGFDTNTDSNQVAHGNAIIDADNTWGDGNQYFTNLSTTSTTGQTAAVDAHHGLAATWDYYGHIHGRNGIDGLGTATFNRVHYSEDGNSFDNAFWDDDCFC